MCTIRVLDQPGQHLLINWIMGIFLMDMGRGRNKIKIKFPKRSFLKKISIGKLSYPPPVFLCCPNSALSVDYQVSYSFGYMYGSFLYYPLS